MVSLSVVDGATGIAIVESDGSVDFGRARQQRQFDVLRAVAGARGHGEAVARDARVLSLVQLEVAHAVALLQVAPPHDHLGRGGGGQRELRQAALERAQHRAVVQNAARVERALHRDGRRGRRGWRGRQGPAPRDRRTLRRGHRSVWQLLLRLLTRRLADTSVRLLDVVDFRPRHFDGGREDAAGAVHAAEALAQLRGDPLLVLVTLRHQRRYQVACLALQVERLVRGDVGRGAAVDRRLGVDGREAAAEVLRGAEEDALGVIRGGHVAGVDGGVGLVRVARRPVGGGGQDDGVAALRLLEHRRLDAEAVVVRVLVDRILILDDAARRLQRRLRLRQPHYRRMPPLDFLERLFAHVVECGLEGRRRRRRRFGRRARSHDFAEERSPRHGRQVGLLRSLLDRPDSIRCSAIAGRHRSAVLALVRRIAANVDRRCRWRGQHKFVGYRFGRFPQKVENCLIRRNAKSARFVPAENDKWNRVTARECVARGGGIYLGLDAVALARLCANSSNDALAGGVSLV